MIKVHNQIESRDLQRRNKYLQKKLGDGSIHLKDSIEQEESSLEGDNEDYEDDERMNRTLYGDPIIRINENKHNSQASQMSQCSMTSELDPDE